LTGRLLCLDSCVLIYFLEGGPFGPAAKEVIRAVRRGRAEAVISTLAFLEVQVGPYRKDYQDLADQYFVLLQELVNCRWVPLSYRIADRAAQIQAEHRLAVPDSIHLATALESSAGVFITNDRDLPAIPGLEYRFLGG